MENTLATVYIGIISVLAVAYLIFYFYIWIDNRTSKDAIDTDNRAKPSEPAIGVVGKSNSVFLAPLVDADVKPFMSEDLKPEQDAIAETETEPDVLPADVDANLNSPYVPDEDELDDLLAGDTGSANHLSQGLTFEQINHALDVVEGRKHGENNEYFAGETFSVMPSDFLTVICMQADYESAVKKLMAGYLDFPGKMKPVKASVESFDISKYV